MKRMKQILIVMLMAVLLRGLQYLTGSPGLAKRRLTNVRTSVW